MPTTDSLLKDINKTIAAMAGRERTRRTQNTELR